MATVYKLCTSVFEKEESTGNPVLSLRLKGLSFSLLQSTAAGSRRTRCKRLLHPTKVSLQRCAGNVKHHHDHVPPARYAAFSRSVCSSSVRVLSIISAICCWVL